MRVSLEGGRNKSCDLTSQMQMNAQIPIPIVEKTPRMSIKTQIKERCSPFATLDNVRNDYYTNKEKLCSTGYINHHKTEESDNNKLNDYYINNKLVDAQYKLDGKKTTCILNRYDCNDQILRTDTYFDITDGNINNDILQIDEGSKKSDTEQIPFIYTITQAIDHLKDVNWSEENVYESDTKKQNIDPDKVSENNSSMSIKGRENVTEDNNICFSDFDEIDKSPLGDRVSGNNNSKISIGLQVDINSEKNISRANLNEHDNKGIDNKEYCNLLVDSKEYKSIRNESFETKRNSKEITADQNKINGTNDYNFSSGNISSNYFKKSKREAIIVRNNNVKIEQGKKNSLKPERLISCLEAFNQTKNNNHKNKFRKYFYSNQLNNINLESNVPKNTAKLKNDEFLLKMKIDKSDKNSIKFNKSFNKNKINKKEANAQCNMKNKSDNKTNSYTTRNQLTEEISKHIDNGNTIRIPESNRYSNKRSNKTDQKYKIAYKILQKEFVDLSAKYNAVNKNYNDILGQFLSSKMQVNNNNSSKNNTKKNAFMNLCKRNASCNSNQFQIKSNGKISGKEFQPTQKMGINDKRNYKNKNNLRKHLKFKSADLNICYNKNEKDKYCDRNIGDVFKFDGNKDYASLRRVI